VHYGEEIQLRHVQSGKFLTYKESFLAEDKKNAVRGMRQLKLVDNYDVFRDDATKSIGTKSFMLHPRFDYRQEGDEVLNNDGVILKALPNAGSESDVMVICATEMKCLISSSGRGKGAAAHSHRLFAIKYFISVAQVPITSDSEPAFGSALRIPPSFFSTSSPSWR
jgi:hypothetical protein